MEEGEQRAKELAVMFIETSAKTSYNVKQVGGFKIGFDFEKQHKYFFLHFVPVHHSLFLLLPLSTRL